MKGPHKVGDIVATRYRVDAWIGEGGMQFVYLAYDLTLSRVVALKTPKNASAAKRFQRSAEVAAQVNHPNVAKTLDYLEDGDRAYLVEELIQGDNLEEAILKRVEAVDPNSGAKIFHHLAKGLAAAHHAGVIHRDIKPTNIMVSGGFLLNEIKVTDFGIAKMADEELAEAAENNGATLALSLTAMGALPYMSPEAIDTPRQVGQPSDVWSLGAMMFHVLTGSPPYGIGLRIVGKILEANPPVFPPFLTSNPQFAPLSKQLIALILLCMQKDPALRPTADEVVVRASALCYSMAQRHEGVVDEVKFNAFGWIQGDENRVFFHLTSAYGERRPSGGDRVAYSKFDGGGAFRAHPVIVLRNIEEL